jgi:hypothetical protein
MVEKTVLISQFFRLPHFDVYDTSMLFPTLTSSNFGLPCFSGVIDQCSIFLLARFYMTIYMLMT